MGWIVAVAIIFVGLLVAFPKWRLSVLVLGVIGIACAWGVAIPYGQKQDGQEHEAEKKAEIAKIATIISTDAKQCGIATYAILIGFKNNNSFPIDKIYFDLNGYRSDHSSKIYSSSLASDAILQNGALSTACWALDSYKLVNGKISGLSPAEVKWEVSIFLLEKSR